MKNHIVKTVYKATSHSPASPSGVGRHPSHLSSWTPIFALLSLYLVVSATSALLRADAFFLGKSDTALTLNSLWRAGHFQNQTSYAGAWKASYFMGAHITPMGFAYGVLYRLLPGITTGLLLHAASFTASGFFTYRTCEKICGDRLAALLLTANYLFCYTPAILHIYPEDWTTPYISAAVYFTLDKRYRAATACWVLAMLFKEYVGIGIAAHAAALFLVAALRRPKGEGRMLGDARVFLSWTLLCASYSLLALTVLMPLIQPDWSQMREFSTLGGSRTEAIITLITSPRIWVERIGAYARYLSSLMSPSAFLSAGGPEYLSGILPVLALNLLHDNFQHIAAAGPSQHYVTMFQPFLTAAAAVGLARLRAIGSRARRLASAALLAWVFIQTVVGARMHGYYLKQGVLFSRAFAAHSEDVRAVLGSIPEGHPVSADTEYLLPALAERDVVNPILAHLHQPAFVVEDSFYGESLNDTIDGVMARGWRGLAYDLRGHAPTRPPPCARPGFRLRLQRGSVALCETAGFHSTQKARPS